MVAFESAEHPADLVNYGERAWCRLETYMFMCVGEILMRPIHYFGFGMMPGEKGVCFLEEYIIPTSVQPASLPARPPSMSLDDALIHYFSVNLPMRWQRGPRCQPARLPRGCKGRPGDAGGHAPG